MFHSTIGRVDGADTFLYSADCNGPDYFAIPKGDSKVWRKWQRFFDKLPAEKNLVLQITFEGKSEVATSGLFGSLDGWARAEITFSKILSITNVTGTASGVLSDDETAKPEVERIEGLRATMRGFLGSLYVPSNTSKDILDYLTNDFHFIDLDGKSFTREEYPTVNAPWADLSSKFRESRMSWELKSKTSQAMTWRGTVVINVTDGPAKTYYCDLTFILKDGKWMIREARMSTLR